MSMSVSLPQRVPENVPGDFYVVGGICLQCCIVHKCAPGLMNDLKQPFEECFFRRQPQTPGEIEQAIAAIEVSEVSALRYGGNDPGIISRLKARECGRQCDQTEEGRAALREMEAILKKGREEVAEKLPGVRGEWWRRLLG